MKRSATESAAAAVIRSIRQDLALANRILARERIVDTFGHVSVRSPLRPDRLFMARSKAPERVVPDDIVELDLTGEPVDPDAPKSYLERFIHTEIYRARPEVHSVVHSHSQSVLPFSVVPEVPMRSVCHTAGFIGHQVPVFEIRGVGGDATDLLVSTRELGEALAKEIGDGPIVLMRGHGFTTVGASLRQAVFRAVYADINARVQLKALQLGNIIYLTPDEARVATSTDVAFDRAWDLWTSQVCAELPPLTDEEA
jgi:ribulose-5-phosphate 4-epimerase/fuculose-1-phosphate aldolase